MNTELDKTIQCLRDDLRALENKREKACSSWGGLLDWLEDCGRFDELEDAYRTLDNAHDDYIAGIDGDIRRVTKKIKDQESWLHDYRNEIHVAACKLGLHDNTARAFASAWVDSGGRMPVDDAFERIVLWQRMHNRNVIDMTADDFITFAELAGANQLV